MFKHFLITRFNLRAEVWKTTRLGAPVLTDEWLDHRFRLFDEWCFPSVKNQTNKNFLWLVCFDTMTPKNFRDRISYYNDSLDAFIPIFVDGQDSFRSALSEAISEMTTEADTHIITSRLDNDDSIHVDYVATVQKGFHSQDFGVIDVSDGLQVCLSLPIQEIRRVNDPYNPFVSLAERNIEPKTVLSRMHYAWEGCSDVTRVEGKPMWIQVIHDQNIINDVRRGSLLVRKLKFSSFGLAPKSLSLPSPIAVLMTNASIRIRWFLSLPIRIIKKFLRLARRN